MNYRNNLSFLVIFILLCSGSQRKFCTIRAQTLSNIDLEQQVKKSAGTRDKGSPVFNISMNLELLNTMPVEAEKKLQTFFELMLKDYIKRYTPHVIVESEIKNRIIPKYITRLVFKYDCPLNWRTFKVYTPEGEVDIHKEKIYESVDYYYKYFITLRNPLLYTENIIITLMDNNDREFAVPLDNPEENYILKYTNGKRITINFKVKSDVNNYAIINNFFSELTDFSHSSLNIVKLETLANNIVNDPEVINYYEKNLRDRHIRIIYKDEDKNRISLITKMVQTELTMEPNSIEKKNNLLEARVHNGASDTIGVDIEDIPENQETGSSVADKNSPVPFNVCNKYEFPENCRVDYIQFIDIIINEEMYLNAFMKSYQKNNFIKREVFMFDRPDILVSISYETDSVLDIFKFSFFDNGGKQLNFIPGRVKKINEFKYKYFFYPGKEEILDYKKPVIIKYAGEKIPEKYLKYKNKDLKDNKIKIVKYKGNCCGNIEDIFSDLAGRSVYYNALLKSFKEFKGIFSVDWSNITWNFIVTSSGVIEDQYLKIAYKSEYTSTADKSWYFFYGKKLEGINNADLNHLVKELDIHFEIKPEKIFKKYKDFLDNKLKMLLLKNKIEELGRKIPSAFNNNKEIIKIGLPGKEEIWPGIIGYRETSKGSEFIILPPYIFYTSNATRKNRIQTYIYKE